MDGIQQERARPRTCDERGAVTIFVLVGLTAFLGMAALAVDLGHLATARTESQRVADAAALAGAAAFVSAPGPAAEALARRLAKDFAARNRVDRSVVLLRDEDIEVDGSSERVRVTVVHTAARGNAIRTIFAGIVGMEAVDVVTGATAEAVAATAVNCPLPLAVPDRWEERGGDPDRYDPGIDRYVPWDPDRPGIPSTGWDASDVGTALTLEPWENAGGRGRGRRGGRGKGKVRGPGASAAYPERDWYYAWRLPGQRGPADYRRNIARCSDPSRFWSIGEPLPTESGRMARATRRGVRQLIDSDPDAAWNSRLACVTDRARANGRDPADCRSSPRVRALPLFDPTVPPEPGRQPLGLVSFAGVFVERLRGTEVVGILTGYSGRGAAGGAPATPRLVKVVRLVE